MFKLIVFIELCKISKLVIYLNSCSMDLAPKSIEHEFRYMTNLLILHNLINIINPKKIKTPNKQYS